MTLPTEIRDREFQKFEDVAGEVAVRTTATVSGGAVEIKDQNSSLKADVETGVSGKNGLVVIIDEKARSVVGVYGSAVIAPSGSATLATFTVPALKRFVFSGAIVGGGESAEFSFLISASTICLVRNSGSTRTLMVAFPTAPEASAAAVVVISATNVSLRTKTFEATISGYTVDA